MIKKLTFMAMMICIAMMIFIVESQIPVLIPIPGVKLGLANIITLICLYLFGKKETFIILILRITLSSIFTGQFSAFLYSFFGAVLCFITMSFCMNIFEKKQIWAVSVFGAISHNIGQLIAASFILKSFVVFGYFPFLLISGIFTGIFTGIASQTLILKSKFITKQFKNI